MREVTVSPFMRAFADDIGEGIVFRPDMTVGEVVAAHRETRRLVALVDAANAQISAEAAA
jgi:hypothetical protein